MSAEPTNSEKPVEEPAEKLGIVCSKCGCEHHYTIYTRPLSDGRIQRRRECRYCGHRFTTHEDANS